jgi:hypothetical protein
MLTFAADWSTVSSLATGAGTLVLAVATFASVRSSNRSARVAEEALLEQRRPVLAQSRFNDPVQKIMFVERHWVHADGGRGVAEHANGNVYLAMSLRNVGAGIGVCQAWAVAAGGISSGQRPRHLPESEFRAQTRDLYIPAGDLGMWQGALRDPDELAFAGVAGAIDAGEPLLVELLYSDQVGEQRTITRFALAPYENQESGDVNWTVSTVRHWFLDRPGPRSESEIEARAQEILSRIDTAAQEAQVADAEAEGDDVAQVEDPQPSQPEPTNGDGAQPRAPEPREAQPRDSDGAALEPTGAPQPITVITRPNCE